ncbi:MAG TPA: DUF4332 domain-containing protein [Candidatus Limnocylindrales bacterium]|nr:DUF4332 domain-containing protein [Candidatus Limnocylindrales bacterium]
MRIDEIEGIGPESSAKLASAGVRTVDDLLEQGAPRSGRELLAQTTGLSPTQILEWVNHADLMRIDGVGSEYSDLLEAAGVDTVAELARRNATNLAQTFAEIDAARPNWIRRVPSEATVAAWIAQAKTMERRIEY